MHGRGGEGGGGGEAEVSPGQNGTENVCDQELAASREKSFLKKKKDEEKEK